MIVLLTTVGGWREREKEKIEGCGVGVGVGVMLRVARGG
jgi:hypothetical protein